MRAAAVAGRIRVLADRLDCDIEAVLLRDRPASSPLGDATGGWVLIARPYPTELDKAGKEKRPLGAHLIPEDKLFARSLVDAVRVAENYVEARFRFVGTALLRSAIFGGE